MILTDLLSTTDRVPRPFSHEYPRTPEEAAALDEWQLAVVEQFLDASVEAIKTELLNRGLSEGQATIGSTQIERHVLSYWALAVLTGNDGPSPPRIKASMERRFSTSCD